MLLLRCIFVSVSSLGVGLVLEAGRDGAGVPPGHAPRHARAEVVARHRGVGGLHHPHPVKHDVLQRRVVTKHIHRQIYQM